VRKWRGNCREVWKRRGGEEEARRRRGGNDRKGKMREKGKVGEVVEKGEGWDEAEEAEDERCSRLHIHLLCLIYTCRSKN